MRLKQDAFAIEVFEDRLYSPDSTDNRILYDEHFAMPNSGYQSDNQYGIRTERLDGTTICQVCIIASGGQTRIHAGAVVLYGQALMVCCGDAVFSFTVPQLDLRWQVLADMVTCFALARHKDGVVVHGELAITKLDGAGRTVWEFSGPDIFIAADGQEAFRVVGDNVSVRCWEHGTFVLDANTGDVIRHEPER